MTIPASHVTFLGSQALVSKGDLSAGYEFYSEGASNLSGTDGVRVPLGPAGDWIVDNKVNGTYAKTTSTASAGHTHSDLHSHANKTVLDKVSNADRVTASERADWNDAVSKEHVHTNSAVINNLSNADRVTTTERTNWNSAVSDQHIHGNKATLDLIPAYSAGDSGKVLKGSGGTLAWATDATGGGGGGLSNIVSDATPQLGGNLDLNAKYIDADATPNSDHTGQGGFRIEVTAGQNVSALHGARIRPDGNWAMTDADNLSTALGVGIFLSTTASGGTVGVLTPFPIMRDDSWNWTVGSPIFFHTTTGDLTQTQPSGANDYIVAAGIATHADRMLLTPGYCYIKHA